MKKFKLTISILLITTLLSCMASTSFAFEDDLSGKFIPEFRSNNPRIFILIKDSRLNNKNLKVNLDYIRNGKRYSKVQNVKIQQNYIPRVNIGYSSTWQSSGRPYYLEIVNYWKLKDIKYLTVSTTATINGRTYSDYKYVGDFYFGKSESENKYNGIKLSLDFRRSSDQLR